LKIIRDVAGHGMSIPDSDFDTRRDLANRARSLCTAEASGDREAKREVQYCLNKLYERAFSPERDDDQHEPLAMLDVRRVLESHLLGNELRQLPVEAIESSPEDGPSYIRWLKALIKEHPSSLHPFFTEFLNFHANKDELRYFMAQESTLDPRFDDILALMQIGAPGVAKMEMARNYWDEMGNGDDHKVHSALFKQTLVELEVDAAYLAENVSLEAMVTGNISACLALEQRFLWMAVGYFGVIEYVPPRRLKYLVTAMVRNGLTEDAIAYHRLHAVIDAHHATGWFNNVVIPAVAESPRRRHAVTRGAFLRLNASLRYLNDIAKTLKIDLRSTLTR
jgi:hypothetical protein